MTNNALAEAISGLERILAKQDPPQPPADPNAPQQSTSDQGWARERGLVPETGDWEHPGHWVKPEGAEEPPQEEIPQYDLGTSSKRFFRERGLKPKEDNFAMHHAIAAQAKRGRETGWAPTVTDEDMQAGVDAALAARSTEVPKRPSPRPEAPAPMEEAPTPEPQGPSRPVTDDISQPSKTGEDKLLGLMDSESKARAAKLAKEVGAIVPLSHMGRVLGVKLNSYSHGQNEGDWITAGSFNPDSKKIELWKEAKQSELIHEIGHSIYIPGKTSDLPNSIKDGIDHVWYQARRSGEGFPSEYSRENKAEFVAECYSAHMQEPTKFAKRNPEMSSIMKELTEHLEQKHAARH